MFLYMLVCICCVAFHCILVCVYIYIYISLFVLRLFDVFVVFVGVCMHV